jgi:MFS family permease
VAYLNQIKTVLWIQISHSFASGILGVALPLMMKDRNVDTVTIGFVFASMPLIMQFGRMFFATVSDFLGRKPFFVSSGVLGFVSGLIYYVAHAPLDFLFGKVVEGTQEGALWAVNRPFLLEKSDGHWRILVNLRAVVYIASAVGSLVSGFLVVWFFYEGTMLLCALFGILMALLSLLLVSERRGRFSMTKALHFLDFRKKERIFQIFLLLFFVMGLTYGFIGGFVVPFFLTGNGFNAEMVGLIVGVQTLLSGLFSFLFSKSTNMRSLTLLSGVLFSATLFSLGISFSLLAGALTIFCGAVQGMNIIGQEGILTKICDRESYGIDIGLIMMGFHIGESLGLALSGILVSLWGYAAPFFPAAITYAAFFIGAYLLMKE